MRNTKSPHCVQKEPWLSSKQAPSLTGLFWLYRYCLEKEDVADYVLCDVIGQTGADHQWKTECLRVVGDHERPLMLQALWKPKQGLSRRFEIQRRVTVEERSARETDNVTAGRPPELN